MSDHPHDLYADYEEGTLGPEDRARVESHLAACRQCREEVEEARGARTALTALPEVEEPSGLASWVARRAGRRPVLSPRLAWAASAAAVAAAVVLAGITFVGNGDEEAGAPVRITEAARPEPAPGAAEMDDAAPAAKEETKRQSSTGFSGAAALPPGLYPVFRSLEANYDPDNLRGFLRDLRPEFAAARKAGFPADAADFYARFEPLETPEPAAAALSCVSRAAQPDRTLVPFLIEEAAFDGAPAYLAAFLQGPRETEAYDRILLMVVERKGCALRHFARQLL